MPNIHRNEFDIYQSFQSQSSKGYLDVALFGGIAIAAANATNMLNAHAIDGTTVTMLAQPDVARTLQLLGDSGATAVIPLVGTDIRDNAITENVTLNGTTPVITVNAFKTVKPVVLPTQAGKHVSIGFYTGIGLGRLQTFAAPIYAGVDNVADSALPTIAKDAVVISKNFATFATAPNASHKYMLAYIVFEFTNS